MRLVDNAKSRGYLDVSAEDLLAESPKWTIRRIEGEGVAIPCFSERQYLAGDNIASHPALVAEPMSLFMAPGPDAEPSARLAFNFSDPEQPHTLALRIEKPFLIQPPGSMHSGKIGFWGTEPYTYTFSKRPLALTYR